MSSRDDRPGDAAELRQHGDGARRVGEAEFRRIFERSHLGMSITQPSGEAQVNPAFCALLGFSPDEVRQRNWQSFTHPDDVALTQHAVDLLLAGKQASARIIKRFIRKDGAVVWVDLNSTLHRDEAGAPLHFVTIMIDITDRRRAEAALRESEERYRTIVDNISDALFIHDLEGTILDVNECACRFYGYTRSELIGSNLRRLSLPEPASHLTERLERLRAEGHVRFENVSARKDGVHVANEVVARLVSREGKGIVHGFVRDITERKQAEAALLETEKRLRHSEKMEAIGQLAGGVAHDFNNQLGGIMNCAELLLARIEDEESRSYIQGIIRLCGRSADLTSKLLAFSRQGKY